MAPASNICPCCHSQDTTFLYSLNYGDVNECVNCRTAFTSFYESEALEKSNDVFQTADFKKARLYDQYRLRKVARNRLNLLSKFVNHGSILEFGSCTGEFLYEAGRKGYDVYSMDKYDSVLNINKTEKLKGGIISDAGLYKDDKTYDAIVAFHVIEHLTNPGEFLAKCHSLLKPGGVIFLELPNFGGLSRKLFGRRSGIFYDYHVCHFEKQSLTRILEKHNYQVIYAGSLDETMRYICPLYNPIRNAIWRIIKRLICNKSDPVKLKIANSLLKIDKAGEDKIANSLKAKIYRIESIITQGLSIIFYPFTLLLNHFRLGSCIQIVARKD